MLSQAFKEYEYDMKEHLCDHSVSLSHFTQVWLLFLNIIIEYIN